MKDRIDYAKLPFLELWNLAKKPKAKKDYDYEDDLMVEIERRQRLSWPVPECCNESKLVRSIIFEEGGWRLLYSAEVYRNIRIANFPKVKHCPYCGTNLPKMELDKNFTDPVFKGDDYCDTCGERAMSCICLAPTAGYKPAI